MRHKGAERCRECCLPNVLLFDTDLLVGIGHINLGPISTSSYIHSNLVLVREWSDILKGVVILFAGVNHSVKLATLLRYTKKRCSLIYGFHLPPPGRSVPVSYFEIVFAVLEHFWWRKRCQKSGGKWHCNRRREAIIGSQVQEIMPKGA